MSKNTGTSELINYFDLGVNGDVGISGSLDINTIANATTDTDKFLVSDSGVIKYRTGAELLSDIGGQVSGNYVTLDTNQTITGEKLFSALTLQLAAAGSASPTIIRNTSGTTGSTSGYNTIGFNSSNNIFVDTTNRGGFILGFNNSVSNRTYTLQDASGTLAFTSQIPANPVGGTGTTNYLPKFTSASTIGNSNLINDTSGNLGLGVTPSAWISNFKGLQVKNASLMSFDNLSATLSQNAFYDGAWKYISTDFATQYGQVGGEHQWFIAPSGTAGNPISFTQAMTLFSTGNLGIGVGGTDSGFKLEVNGTGRFSGALQVTSNITAINGAMEFSGSGSAPSTDPAIYRVGGVNSLQFAIGGSPRLTISSTGAATFSSSVTGTQFITGGTPSNTAGFTNSFYAESNIPSLTLSNTGTNTGKYTLGVTNGNFGIWNNATSSYPFFINSSNNVGIGTVSPTTKLHVETPTGNDQVARFSRGPSNAGDIMFGLGDYGGGYQARMGAQQLVFEVNRANGAGLDTGTMAMFIKSSGNVGIGTTTDAGYKLDVNGKSRIGNSANSSVDDSLFLHGKGITSGGIPYGDYGSIVLGADASYTSGARRFLITNGYISNRFAIIQSVDANTTPTLGAGGGINSGVIIFSVSNTGAAEFSVPLLGTSATFSSSVTAAGAYINNASFTEGATYFDIDTFGGKKLRLNNAGNQLIMGTNGIVSIGSVGNNGSGAVLQVTGAATFSSSVTANTLSSRYHTMPSGSGFNAFEMGNDPTAGGWYIYDLTNSQYRLTIKNNGNVLIGTTTDVGAKLYVNGAIRTEPIGSGGVTGNWKFGNEVSGTISENTSILVEIDGREFRINAREV
jgi:hypothetical protein